MNSFYYDGYFYNADFQTPATPISEGILHFHHDLMILLTFICFFILWILSRTLIIFCYKNDKNLVLTRGGYSFNYFKHQGMFLEIVWTLIPAIILMLIAIPSMILLYSSSVSCDLELSFKIIGHQWFWSYEVNDGESKSMKALTEDSYMVTIKNQQESSLPRNLLTNILALMPVDVYIRLLFSSDDVLHCWAVPAFGVKVDACPGRLNSVNIFIKREGLFFGQCSEICGINHAFMPIGVAALSTENWIISRLVEASNNEALTEDSNLVPLEKSSLPQERLAGSPKKVTEVVLKEEQPPVTKEDTFFTVNNISIIICGVIVILGVIFFLNTSPSITPPITPPFTPPTTSPTSPITPSTSTSLGGGENIGGGDGIVEGFLQVPEVVGDALSQIVVKTIITLVTWKVLGTWLLSPAEVGISLTEAKYLGSQFCSCLDSLESTRYCPIMLEIVSILESMPVYSEGTQRWLFHTNNLAKFLLLPENAALLLKIQQVKELCDQVPILESYDFKQISQIIAGF